MHLEERFLGDSNMQEQNLEKEVDFLRERLGASEEGRGWALHELKQVKKEANSRLQEASTPRKMVETYTELNSVKKLLVNANQELEAKEEDIANLRAREERAKQLELELKEKDAAMKKLKEEMDLLRNPRPVSDDKMVRELEEQLAGQKNKESKLVESIAAMTEKLEQSKSELAESKLQIVSLQEKLEGSSSVSSLSESKDSPSEMDEMLEALNDELQQTRENLCRAQDGEKQALVKAQNLLGEIGKLRNELKSANEAEENGKKALDDLALALKEVTTELAEVKMKHHLAQSELEHWKNEAEDVKSKAKSAEEKYKSLLDEASKEAEKYKNTAERLRHEAEESLLAWNDKETMFVGCIRRAEEEKTLAQQETIRLLENIQSADNMVRSSKDETNKVRDILKQAINESNVAKEAANIAKAENSQLKDSLAEKEEALNFLTREIEILRENEIAAMENIKELKRLIAETTMPTAEDKDSRWIFRKQSSMEKEKDGRKLGKAFSFNLKELRIHTKHKDLDNAEDNTNSSNYSSRSKDPEENKAEEDDSDKDDEMPLDPLKGSIFDVETPGSAAHHRRRSSLTFTSDGELNIEELDTLEDLENERLSSRRKKWLLRRFGDLLVRRRTGSSGSGSGSGSGEIKHKP